MANASTVPIQRLIAAVEQAHECIAVSDANGVLEYVNPAFEQMSGYTAEEIIGHTFKPFQSGLHDDAFYAELRDTIEAGRTWRGYFINRKKNGSLYEEQATISPVRDEGGEITGFVAVKRDVTQERMLARELQETRAKAAVLESERELLDGTVAGTVRMLTEVLAMTRPSSFGRSTRIAQYVRSASEAMGIRDWSLEMAGMLSQIGVVAVAAEIHEKATLGVELSPDERLVYDGHPRIAMQLLTGIPRLERVAKIIGESANRAPTSAPSSEVTDTDECPFPVAVAVLKAALRFDELMCSGATRGEALKALRDVGDEHSARVASAFESVPIAVAEMSEKSVNFADLTPEMFLLSDVLSARGTLLVRGDQPVTLTLLTHLRRIAAAHGVQEPIRVRAPLYSAVAVGS